MQVFTATYPDDLLVKGDEKHLIIAISLKILVIGVYGYKSTQEDFRSDELYEVDASKLNDETRLRTNTGKWVALEFFRPPGKDRAGSTYYFPRNFPDGTPLISLDDKELYFETFINKKQVVVKFDLNKMNYKGKREF